LNHRAATLALIAGAALATPALSAEPQREPPSALRGHGGPVKALAIINGGRRLVTGSFDSTLIVWDPANGSAHRVLRFHGSTVNAVVGLDRDCFASGGEDGRIAAWCGTADRPQRQFDGHTAPISQLALSPDRRHLASVSFDRSLRLWPLDTEADPRVLDTAAAPLGALAFMPDGSGIVIGGYDGAVKLIPLDGQAQPASLMLGTPINAVVAHADGRIMTAGADGHIRVFDRTLRPLADHDVGTGPLTTLAVTPDGRTAATAGMRTQVTLVDLDTGKTRFEILGPGLPVWTLALSEDGSELWTGGQDRIVRRWVTATGKPAGRDADDTPSETIPLANHPGAQVFKACAACHGVTAGDTLKAGPTLAGLFGRRIGSLAGYDFSPALRGMSIVWTPETVSELFTRGPLAYTPGTKMPEQRITNRADLAALVEWLGKVTVAPE
jgi:cytochrome c